MENFRRFIKICCGLFIAILHVAQADLNSASLETHNSYRKPHGSPPLAVDTELTKFAQNKAEELAEKDEKLVHTPNNKYGENLYYAKTKGTELRDDSESVKFAIKQWYDEISKYDFSKPGFSGATGHFTQVVWKGSKLVGIGVKRNSKGDKVFVVAEYSPRGNNMNTGQFAANVLRKKKSGGSQSESGVESKGETDTESKSVQLQWATKIVSLIAILCSLQ